MANNKMLIDATHPEETRVVVLRNGRVEEFDYESAARKLLRGSIYLAKVTRVEPSLQAAFIDYGGNRHGFLAFNEIHPDYYQIPFADRQALLNEEAEQEAREEAEADARAERLERRQRQQQLGGGNRSRGGSSGRGMRPDDDASGLETISDLDPANDQIESGGGSGEGDQSNYSVALDADQRDEKITSDMPQQKPVTIGGFEGDPSDVEVSPDDDDSEDDENPADDSDVETTGADDSDDSDDDDGVDIADEPDDEDQGDGSTASEGEINSAPETASDGVDAGTGAEAGATVASDAIAETGLGDAIEELPSRQRRRPRSYKIQEVIKRRQVILVQVVKEERGTKGAALTTYLSLAGRYTVLMPNTGRGGGISRKITQPQDRKRLKAIANELEVPEGMGLIIRTAGAARTKQEIKRDFEYLLRLWESVRELTLESTAPSLVYEEGDLIKRSIRDLYNKDVEEIYVAGDQAHKDAHDFMQMLMPSHAKNVIKHSGHESLFTKHGIERQLNAMFSPYVTLRSGGYLVINQTEALVAIDVNSGKSTREFSIEETALNTNLEAADEVARQVKLRDLAGLVVIDFIDMEEKRNNRAVERRIKDALRFDRARIQLGHISHFGLLEMSRQRMRTGVLEGSTTQCPHCQGTGTIRATESVALAVLRGLEDALMAGSRASLTVTTTTSVALYILNSKRAFLNELEGRYGVSLNIQASDKLQGANYSIERGPASAAVPAAMPQRRIERSAVNMESGFDGEDSNVAAEEPELISSGDDETEAVPDTAPLRHGRRDGRDGGRNGGRDRDSGRGPRSDRNDRTDRGDRNERDTGDEQDVRSDRAAADGNTGDGRGGGRNRRRRGGRGRDGDRGGDRGQDSTKRGDRDNVRGDRDGVRSRSDARVFGPGEDQPDLNGGPISIGGADGEGTALLPAASAQPTLGPRDGADTNRDEQGDRAGRRRRRGRRGGRGGRDRRPGQEEGGVAASAETSGFHPHVGEERIDDFSSAVPADDTNGVQRDANAQPDMPRREREPREPRQGRDTNRPRRNDRNDRQDRPDRNDRARSEPGPSREPAAARPANDTVERTPTRAPEPVVSASRDTVEAPARRRASSSELMASEPVIESVVVRQGEVAPVAGSEPAAPKRGWWQRNIG